MFVFADGLAVQSVGELRRRTRNASGAVKVFHDDLLSFVWPKGRAGGFGEERVMVPFHFPCVHLFPGAFVLRRRLPLKSGLIKERQFQIMHVSGGGRSAGREKTFP